MTTFIPQPRVPFLALCALVLASILCMIYLLFFWKPAATPAAFHWTKSDNYVVAVTYADPHDLANVQTFGPVGKPAECEQAAVSVMGQLNGPGGEDGVSIATCLAVNFGGPLGPKGAVVVQPYKGAPLGYVLIAFEYAHDGTLIGTEALHMTPDPKRCAADARMEIDGNVASGKVPADASLLIYCLGVPVLPSEQRKDSPPSGGSV